jgi:hypothetical protein
MVSPDFVNDVKKSLDFLIEAILRLVFYCALCVGGAMGLCVLVVPVDSQSQIYGMSDLVILILSIIIMVGIGLFFYEKKYGKKN